MRTGSCTPRQWHGHGGGLITHVKREVPAGSSIAINCKVYPTAKGSVQHNTGLEARLCMQHSAAPNRVGDCGHDTQHVTRNHLCIVIVQCNTVLVLCLQYVATITLLNQNHI